MTAQFTELVRDSLDHLTDGATVPAGLAARAGHRVRQRAVIRLAAAGMAAATGAAVLVTAIGTAGTPRAVKPGTAGLTAYVVSQASRALTAASDSAVSQAWLMQGGGGGTQVISWSAPGSARTEIIEAAGIVGAGGYVVRDGSYEFVTIDYRDRTWEARRASTESVRASSTRAAGHGHGAARDL